MNEIRINEPDNGRKLREFMAQRTRTDADDWFLTFRAREAMQVVFEELRSLRGDGQVALQPFTCSTVPEAVLAAGLEPLYCDISGDDLSIDTSSPGLTNALAESSTRAVILQHTYGIFNQRATDDLADKAHESGVLLMEDCAHRVGRMAFRGDSSEGNIRPAADVSVHSFGVEKMINSNFGGAIWINPAMEDAALRDRLRKRFAELPSADKRADKSVGSYVTRIRVLNHLPGRIRRPLRSFWVSRKSFIPAVDASELAGNTLLEPSVPGEEVIRRVLAALADINFNESKRQIAVGKYIQALSCDDAKEGSCYTIPACALEKIRPLLWFPVITDSRNTAEKLVSRLSEAGFYSSTWGRPLLFPGVTDPEKFALNQAYRDCPEAVRCAERIALLPTKHSEEEADKIIEVFRSVMAEAWAESAASESMGRAGSSEDTTDFVPILLGTETNVYNMARSFHEAYGIKSIAYGVYPLSQSAASGFVDVICNPDFNDPEGFVRVLNTEAYKYRGRKAILLSCGDNYTRILAKVKGQLDPVYIVVCPDYDVVDSINSKVRFYQYCEDAGIPYPKTVIISDTKVPDLPFDFPLVLKPDDADDYYAHPFEGQKKAFILEQREDLIAAVNGTYASGYSGKMLIQEFIPGGDDNMRVVNGYKRSDGTLALMSMGQPLLEDYYPMAIGNYNVILASGDDSVYDTVEKLLGSIPYLGYFNMDLKYDHRDGIFKVFDFNPRMGRSSYYVTLSGHNLARCVVDDVVYHKPVTTVRSYDEYLWADIPFALIKKYVENEAQRDHALELIRKGRAGGTYRKANDRNIRRLLIQTKADLRSIRNYHRYFRPKEQ